ncbi:NAD-dependent epimerase/dehydratase family protein [Brevibacillus laterosporus]|uniref:NAD(P)-dependent oxidoreductase n=1 Tax=Brevibacillus laterosporus TaxID=1465 RepID=A0AAP8Q921_BRELA|nr:NAD(P)-dependent oxidoreductase [Brevibacillus laterosporus]PPA91381.1 NAD(P)-dependent oxidoreductase [Brevibacillus laterosporus]
MKIFVAGAVGVIGRSLIPLLVQDGHEVFGMTHHTSHTNKIVELGAKPFVADAFNREAIFTVLHRTCPDVVIHQLTSLHEQSSVVNAKIRIEGTRNLVDASLSVGVKRMIAQSISWAYEPGEGPAAEEVPLDLDAPMPRKITIDGIVALEKAIAEIPESVILRYGTLYGPGTWYDLHGEKVHRNEMTATEGVSSFLHVEDAARAAFLALDWPSGPVNIVDDEPASGTLWLPAYASMIGAPQPTIHSGSNRGERGALNTKARIYYDWTPLHPSWREGFKNVLK